MRALYNQLVVAVSDPCEYVGVTGEQCDRVKQLLSTKQKRKRAPSVYNMYASACIKAKGGIKKFGEGGPIMKQCAAEYREDKKKGGFRYKVETPPDSGKSFQGYTKGGQAQLWKGRDMAKEWHDLYRKIGGGR